MDEQGLDGFGGGRAAVQGHDGRDAMLLLQQAEPRRRGAQPLREGGGAAVSPRKTRKAPAPAPIPAAACTAASMPRPAPISSPIPATMDSNAESRLPWMMNATYSMKWVQDKKMHLSSIASSQSALRKYGCINMYASSQLDIVTKLTMEVFDEDKFRADDSMGVVEINLTDTYDAAKLDLKHASNGTRIKTIYPVGVNYLGGETMLHERMARLSKT